MESVNAVLKKLEQPDTDGLIGRKCKVKNYTPEYGTCMDGILTVVSIQRVYGYDSEGNYGLVDGCRVTGPNMKDRALTHTPIALNELEWV